MDDDSQLLRAEQCADILSVSRATFFNYVNRDILPPPIKIGCLSRWRRSDLDDAVNELAAKRYESTFALPPKANIRVRKRRRAEACPAATV